jgi:hypothetical protein
MTSCMVDQCLRKKHYFYDIFTYYALADLESAKTRNVTDTPPLNFNSEPTSYA